MGEGIEKECVMKVKWSRKNCLCAFFGSLVWKRGGFWVFWLKIYWKVKMLVYPREHWIVHNQISLGYPILSGRKDTPCQSGSGTLNLAGEAWMTGLVLSAHSTVDWRLPRAHGGLHKWMGDTERSRNMRATCWRPTEWQKQEKEKKRKRENSDQWKMCVRSWRGGYSSNTISRFTVIYAGKILSENSSRRLNMMKLHWLFLTWRITNGWN